VFTAPQGTRDPAIRDAMTALFEKVDAIEGVKVTSPYSPEGAQLNSADGTISFAQLNFTQRGQAEAQALGNEIKELGEQVAVPGSPVEYGGQLFSIFEFPESELLGHPRGGHHPARRVRVGDRDGAPIGTRCSVSGVGVAIVGSRRTCCRCPSSRLQMTAMIGLGVGIDYALLHRHALPREPAQGLVAGAGRRSRRSTARAGACCSPG
jgi:RND superfamily putative drug exporter